MSQAELPRYKCESCGNLTRFDVVATETTRAFHHFDVGGELTIEDNQIMSRTVESVTCRWCDNGGAVVELTGDALTSVDDTAS